MRRPLRSIIDRSGRQRFSAMRLLLLQSVRGFWVVIVLVISLRDEGQWKQQQQRQQQLWVGAAKPPADTWINDSSGSCSGEELHEKQQHEQDKKPPQCRAAYALSGHIRSFAQPRVHQSVVANVLRPLRQGGCRVDVFLYLTREDEVPPLEERGASHWNRFTPHTPSLDSLGPALALLAPVRWVWHQEQAGLIPNGCNMTTPSGDAKVPGVEAAYWQLYKNLAVYNMVEEYEHEQQTHIAHNWQQHGVEEEPFRYDWILRSRLDIGWMAPLPPLLAFPSDRAYFGSSFWPLSDQFALLPRHLARRYFTAIHSFYRCPPVGGSASDSAVANGGINGGRWWVSFGAGVTENLLWQHLHHPPPHPPGPEEAAPLSRSEMEEQEQGQAYGHDLFPYQYYDFNYVIVRSSEGGMCDTFLPLKLPMQLMHSYGRMGMAVDGGSQQAVGPVHKYHKKVCQMAFPPVGQEEEAEDQQPRSSSARRNSSSSSEEEGEVEEGKKGKRTGEGREEEDGVSDAAPRGGGGGGGEDGCASPSPASSPPFALWPAADRDELTAIRAEVLEAISLIDLRPHPQQQQGVQQLVIQQPTLRVLTLDGHASQGGVVGQVATAFLLTDGDVLTLGQALRCEMWRIVYGDSATAAECSSRGGMEGDGSGREATSLLSLHSVWASLWPKSKHVGTCEGRCSASQLRIPLPWMQHLPPRAAA